LGDPAAGIIHGRDMQKHGRPLRLGPDVREALRVQKVGEAEVSEHQALAMHATAGSAKVDVVREKPSPRH
jgi:hypothetical protein